MKNIYILIFISALVACNDKNQDKVQSGLNNEQNIMYTDENEKQSLVTNEALPVSESKVITDNVAVIDDSNQTSQISCLNQNITEWYGFDEAASEPKCDVVKNFKLQSYKCDVSKNAFGADKDAILLENQDQRIFIYSDSKGCNEILEIRNSNAP
ncbi:hypothetical protein [Acinetobacter stercoris]|uniref:Lipoprotein n=1 Tax=Acinetobacter stercoris TaxID=2126983 RepID=A0A2U3N4N5_9GAMM|nr:MULTISPECIES: hypothetical protein [Acinetobacter]SPL72535.1 hypothetical protein KPC_3713 [Acinetobacter stercoris]